MAATGQPTGDNRLANLMVPARVKPHMSRARVIYEDAVNEDICLLGFAPEGTEEVLIPDSQKLESAVMMICIRELNDATDDLAICSYYASAIICVFWSLRYRAIEAFRAFGIKVTTRSLPSQIGDSGLEMVTEVSARKCLVLFGQLILILFKSVNRQGYENYISNRIRGLKAHVELPPTVGGLKADGL